LTQDYQISTLKKQPEAEVKGPEIISAFEVQGLKMPEVMESFTLVHPYRLTDAELKIQAETPGMNIL